MARSRRKRWSLIGLIVLLLLTAGGAVELFDATVAQPPLKIRNEAFATRMASAVAEGLGVSVRGLAEGAGALGRKGADVMGETTKGLGGAIQGQRGGPKKE